MNPKTILFLALAVAFPLVAQDRPSRPGGSSAIKEFDKNADGTLSDDELKLVTELTSLRRTMGAFDLDGNGRMNLDEARAWYTAVSPTSGALPTKAVWRFNRPVDIAITKDGNLVVADIECNVIWQISPKWETKILAGRENVRGAVDGAAASATFSAPKGVACASDGSIFVSDAGNGTIRRISADGIVSTYAGKASTENNGSKDGPRNEATFWEPGRLACDAKGNLFVTQPSSASLRRIAADGKVSTLPPTVYQFAEPYDVAVSADGVIYVADQNDQKEGALVSIVGSQAKTIGKVRHHAVDTDGEGRAIVADLFDNKIFRVTREGEYTTLGPKGMVLVGTSQYALAAAGDGRVFVLTSNQLLQLNDDGSMDLVMQAEK